MNTGPRPDWRETTVRRTLRTLNRQAVIDASLSTPEPRIQLRRYIKFLTSGSRGWGDYYADHGERFLRIGNLSRANLEIGGDIQFVNLPADVTEGSRTMLQEGDLLFSITAYLGSVAVVAGDWVGAYVSQHVALCRLELDRVDPRFIGWFMLTTTGQDQLNESAAGGTKMQLALDDIRGLRIPTTPIEEQRRIAAYLDRETARIDTLIEEQQRLIEMLRERRQAVIEHATATGGTTPPSEWRVATLRRIGRFITGTTPTGEPEDVFDTDGQLGWARPEDLGDRVAPSRRLSALGAAQVRPARDAVLVCCIGATVGKVGWADGLISSNQQITAIEVEGSAKYWYYALTGSRSTLVALAVGNTIPILNNMRLGELEVAVPPITEQHKIAAYLDEKIAKIDTLIEETERFIELARERRAALITAAVTGQIDIREMA